jgi:N-dimethylarginine dimethylaminohydrolase
MRPGAVNHEAARAEQRALVDVLRGLGEHVEVLPFVCGAFDSVFIKDNAVLLEKRALLCAPRHAERRGEQEARARALAELGFAVAVAEHPLEGGDVVPLPGGGALLGCGPRSSEHASKQLSRFLDAEVHPLRLCDPRLYHLDTAMTVLSDGTALFCREAFDESAVRTLRMLVARGVLSRVLTVPLEEALRFAVNVVEVGDAVVTGTHAPVTNGLLRALRRTVIEVPLAQFHLAGGSAACLVATVQRAMTMDATAMRSAAA